MFGRNAHSDRALTPVVGIVLLVAITLLLASTVAAFAFGLEETNRSQQVPTTALNVEYDGERGSDDVLDIVHQSGTALDTSKLEVDVDGATCAGGSDDPNGRYNVASDFGMTGQLTSGEVVRIDGSGPVQCTGSGTLDLSGATITVVWVPETGASSMLREWNGPG